MSPPFSSLLHAVVSLLGLWLVVLCLFSLRGKWPRPGARVAVATALATVLLLFAPFGSISLWNRALSYYPSASVPMLGVVGGAVWNRLSGRAIFKPTDWLAIWIFGATGGTVLYLQSAVFAPLDLYFWGWDRSVAAGGLGGLAIVFLAGGSRFGLLLLAGLLAFALGALESHNCWDYVVDPVYWLISVFALLRNLLLKLVRRNSRPVPGSTPATVGNR